jgi:hypothetical protein
MSEIRSINFYFQLFNYTEEDIQCLKDLDCNKYIYSCIKTLMHGYVQFNQHMSTESAKNELSNYELTLIAGKSREKINLFKSENTNCVSYNRIKSDPMKGFSIINRSGLYTNYAFSITVTDGKTERFMDKSVKYVSYKLNGMKMMGFISMDDCYNIDFMTAKFPGMNFRSINGLLYSILIAFNDGTQTEMGEIPLRCKQCIW